MNARDAEGTVGPLAQLVSAHDCYSIFSYRITLDIMRSSVQIRQGPLYFLSL